MNWALAAMCALLAGVISLELQQGAGIAAAGSAETASTKPGGPDAETLGARFALPPLQQYSEIVERTLFDASRRAPPEALDDMPAAAATELRDLTLTGIVIAPEGKVAFLRDKTPNQVIRLEPGGAVGKWVLAEVRANAVTLRRGAATRELLLFEDDEPQSRPPAAAQPQATTKAREEIKTSRPLTRSERRAQRRAAPPRLKEGN